MVGGRGLGAAALAGAPLGWAIPSVSANGIRIEYDTVGEWGHSVALLIPGLGGQLTGWPDGFCALLAARRFSVVRYDNRDAGLSSSVEGGPAPDPMAVYLGDHSSVAYTLEDLADDAVGVLDALDVEAAHLVGVSMGGMIAQAVAAAYPERVLSLCSISSTTGSPAVGQPTAEGFALLARPPATTREERIAADLEWHRVLGSPGYPTGDDELRAHKGRSFDRAHNPEGSARQLCAILASGDRTASLARIQAPTLVVHGSEDKLIQPSGGEATAEAITGARLMTIKGMGHDLPAGVWPMLVEAIEANAARAARAGHEQREDGPWPRW